MPWNTLPKHRLLDTAPTTYCALLSVSSPDYFLVTKYKKNSAGLQRPNLFHQRAQNVPAWSSPEETVSPCPTSGLLGSYIWPLQGCRSLSLITAGYLCMHALEKEMATHSSSLAWRIPGTEKPGGVPSMRSHRVGED